MGIYKIANDLKLLAINTATVNQSSFGDIELYNNKATIKYPYVNFDIVNSTISDSSINYTFRIYVCDRNEPYIAYNKTRLILNSILKYYSLDADNYTINYFTLNFKDVVNGCWTDFQITEPLEYDCQTYTGITFDYNMEIYQTINNLVELAKSVKMVEGADFGELKLYDNKATIKYPYVNFDIVNSIIENGNNRTTYRIYVMDRNEPYIAYNKCELILNNICKSGNLQIETYNVTYFNLDYQDVVNGCFTDVIIDTYVNYDCLVIDSSTDTFIVNEIGDYIIDEIDNKYIITE